MKIQKNNDIAGWERIKKYKNYFGLSDDVAICCYCIVTF